MGETKGYGMGELGSDAEIETPRLPYRPCDPQHYAPPIGLIGCGGITEYHLRAYRKAGYRVTALMDLDPAKAEARREEFFPDARVFKNHAELLETEVEVIDIATHPGIRGPIVEKALRSGKHVLSQKPFALDLDAGQRLVLLADELGLKLAVNQNGRWAPHFSYIREAVRSGLLGELAAVDITLHWDHSWVVETPFNEVEHLLLFDFGIHWFDFLCTLFPDPARRVHASVNFAPGQRCAQPMLGQIAVEYEQGRASISFHGDSPHFQCDETLVAGTEGTLVARGKDLEAQELRLTTAAGSGFVPLEGDWFNDGFHGTMAELLSAIEEDREPTNSARDNLRSLALAFAACASSIDGQPRSPGECRVLG